MLLDYDWMMHDMLMKEEFGDVADDETDWLQCLMDCNDQLLH